MIVGPTRTWTLWNIAQYYKELHEADPSTSVPIEAIEYRVTELEADFDEVKRIMLYHSRREAL